ncbi:MAG TPA: hypothetical protein VEN79_11860 [Terriglobia bacterium]|nr:hypothetical protein [Terriglobia bacterium]
MEKSKLMKHGASSTRSIILAILVACTLGLSHPLRAQQLERTQTPATPQAQTPTNPASDPGAASGQPPPASPATPQTQSKSPSDPAPAATQPDPAPKVPKNDRIFFALPNYLTVENASHLPPLTTWQKFKTVAEGCFDPVEFAFIGIQAGIDQADNANPTYHQGFIGYSRRFGTDYADAIIGNFGTGAIFPTLLHQDPRYYQMGTGNVFHRIEHAAIRVAITRSDTSGKTQLNFSELFGNSLAAGLSNTYHPGPHTIASSATVLGTQTLLDVAGYELKEFWPDLRRFLLRNRHKT